MLTAPAVMLAEGNAPATAVATAYSPTGSSPSAIHTHRIRQRVKDPAVAEKLIPRDHGFGVQRVPLETHYFEAYNRDNVELVDSSETPIVRVTPTGIETTARTFDFDVIVYSTGFDAFAGRVAIGQIHFPTDHISKDRVDVVVLRAEAHNPALKGAKVTVGLRRNQASVGKEIGQPFNLRI